MRLLSAIPTLLFALLLIGQPVNLPAEDMTGQSPAVYQSPSASKAVQTLNDQYESGNLNFDAYQRASDSLVHPVGADAAPMVEPTTLASPVMEDPQNLLSGPEKTNLLNFLSLIPQSAWTGVATIQISPTDGDGHCYDATPNSLVIKIDAGADPAAVAKCLGSAVGYYDFQYLLDSQTKTEFDGMANQLRVTLPDAIAHYFADSYGINLFIRPQLPSVVSESETVDDATYIAQRVLFFSSLVSPSGQPGVYTYAVSADGSVRRTMLAAHTTSTAIVLGPYTFYMNAQNQITAVATRGTSGIFTYNHPVAVPAAVFRNLLRLPPPVPSRRKLSL